MVKVVADSVTKREYEFFSFCECGFAIPKTVGRRAEDERNAEPLQV